MEFTEKMKYTLEQIKDVPKESMEFDIDINLLEMVDELSKELCISRNDFFELAILKMLVNIETEEYEDGYYSKIIDIYDFYDIDKVLDEVQENKLPILAINPNGKHVVLMRPQEWEDLTTEFDKVLGEVKDKANNGYEDTQSIYQGLHKHVGEDDD